MAEAGGIGPSPVDAVIDEVLGGDFSQPERELAIDEAAYQFFGAVRDQAGELDPQTSHQLNMMVPIPLAERDAILQRTNRVARRVLRPLGYKMLQLQGLDPATADPAAARAALEAPLTAEQQAEVDAEAEKLFKEVYLPEMASTLEELGLETRDPDAAWQEFGEEVMSRREEPKPQRSTAAVAVPSALLGAVVALAVSKLARWVKRRRQQQQWGSEGEEQLVSDSLQDDASAYAE